MSQSTLETEPQAEHEYVACFDVEVRCEVVCIDAWFSAYKRDHDPCASLATRCREVRVMGHVERVGKHCQLDEIRRARAHLELGDESSRWRYPVGQRVSR
jgi:hypothetical protein